MSVSCYDKYFTWIISHEINNMMMSTLHMRKLMFRELLKQYPVKGRAGIWSGLTEPRATFLIVVLASMSRRNSLELEQPCHYLLYNQSLFLYHKPDFFDQTEYNALIPLHHYFSHGKSSWMYTESKDIY